MVTLTQCYLELRARRARLQEAETRGWRDCIPSERQCVAEFEHAFVELLLNSPAGDTLMQVAGGLELGTLPFGVSLAYGPDEDDAQPAAAPAEGVISLKGGRA